MTIFTFLPIFEWQCWNRFLESEANRWKPFTSKNVHRKHFRKCFWSYLQKPPMIGNGVCHFFADFWLTKLKLLSGKVSQSNKNYLNPKLVITSIFENGFHEIFMSKTNVLRVWKWQFSLFWKLLSDKVETGKTRQNLKNYSNSKLFIGSILKIYFKATLRSKTNVLSVWKCHFTLFFKCWVMKLKPFSGKVRQSKENSFSPKIVFKLTWGE